ncbi:SMI1/KNR4 family protein [Moraxella sp. ZY210820]|uniref:SMI1/KNR4 family protein n=1 Tax=unclassified Moraxella TaxID=2685852 RepID=UPI0027307A89|nr:SMI1/KNR4 family protein [Moraxella sp. ZY210820]WLF84409.1 SMI1/KNR4 family protein [Moraxella sp. ZY210820]
MTEADILAQLEQFHDHNEFQQIIDYVEQLTPRYHTANVISALGRAYNNMFWQADDEENNRHYLETALTLFKSVEDELGDTGTWNYRIGYTYFYMNDLLNAQKHLRKVEALGEVGVATKELLQMIDLAIENNVSINEYREGGRGGVEYELNHLLNVLKAKSVSLLDTFQAGVSDEQLADFEQQLGFEVPESFKQWYRTFNGQVDGAKFIDSNSLVHLIPLEQIIPTQQQFMAYLQDNFGQNWQDIQLNAYEFDDIEEVKNVLFNAKWLPMFKGENNSLMCMDLDPQTENGSLGQMIEITPHIDLEYYRVTWCAWSLRQLIENPITSIVTVNPYFTYSVEENCWTLKNGEHLVKDKDIYHIDSTKFERFKESDE